MFLGQWQIVSSTFKNMSLNISNCFNVDQSDLKIVEKAEESSTKGLNCSICSIEVPDEMQLRQHLTGQRHKKAYRILEEQQKIDKKCGVYIKGRIVI